MIWFFLVVLISLLIYAIYEFHHFEQTFLDVSFNSKLNRRVLFLSDFQYDNAMLGFRHHAMKKLVKEVKSLKPDLIIIGGDLVHTMNPFSHLVFPYIKQFGCEMIAIMGNHDYPAKHLVKTFYEENNIKLLVNEAYDYHGITFVGVDDLKLGKPNLDHLPYGDNCVLLSHEPDYFENLTKNYHLGLSGHLHGGQVNLFGYYAPILPSKYGQKYVSGWVKTDTTSVYVSKGLGGNVFGLPLRFFARPEIVILDL